MPRHASDRVKEGFQIWSTRAERNFTRTAELMGVPASTVGYWANAYKWNEQYLSLVQPDGELLAGVARTQIRGALPAVVTRLQCIVAGRKPIYNDQGEQIGETWAASDRDAVQAARLLAQYGFEGGAGMDGIIIETQPVTRPPEGPGVALEDLDEDLDGETDQLSVAELRRHASAMIEATIQAVNTRPSHSRKRV